MKAIHVLFGIDGVEDLRLIDLFGKGQLNQNAVDLRIFIVFIDEGKQSLFCDIIRLVVLDGVKSQFFGGPLLRRHITL